MAPSAPSTSRALVTGASAGIGQELARQLAARGAGLVLVARREQQLRELADRLTRQYAVDVEVLAADLTVPEDLAMVERRVEDVDQPIDLLVNNAGFGAYGRFAELDVDRQETMVALNVTAVLRLTHAAVRAMSSRGRGGVINVASTAAFQPGPFGATYGATKGFVQSFTEALHEELRGTGVHVMSLAPGFTDTEFQQAADVDASTMPAAARMTPAQVVEGALKAYDRGRVTHVPGVLNKVGAVGASLGPSTLSRKVAGFVQGRWSDH